MRKPVAIAAAISSAMMLLAVPRPGLARGDGPAPSSIPQQHIVVLAPLATLGSEAKSRATKTAEEAIAAGLESLPDLKLISMTELKRAVRAAKQPRLRSCDGEPACLAELGKLLGATSVIYGEVGGLGDVQVVYLKLVSSADAKEIRSTTLELGEAGTAGAEARAAAYRLLMPEAYVGRLHVKVDAKGASIYVDGKRIAGSPSKPLALPVGTHALRVTHPEYRDFVRFVKIEFDADETIDAGLQQYPVIRSNLESEPGRESPTTGVRYRGVEPTPWYRRWYTVAGGSAVILIGSAVIVGLIANGIDADQQKTVGED